MSTLTPLPFSSFLSSQNLMTTDLQNSHTLHSLAHVKKNPETKTKTIGLHQGFFPSSRIFLTFVNIGTVVVKLCIVTGTASTVCWSILTMKRNRTASKATEASNSSTALKNSNRSMPLPEDTLPVCILLNVFHAG